MSDRVLSIALHAGQQAIFNSPARFKVVAAGRRFGKSHLAAALLSIAAFEEVNYRGYPITQEHPVYYVAPTFEQARRIIWPKLRQMLGFVISGGYIMNENTNDGWLELVNGHRIYIRGADNPDSLRGISPAFIVMDEYADMKPAVWYEIIEPSLMDVEAQALFIGTPKGKNHFYKMFMGALQKPVDARTGSSPFEDYEAFHFTSNDNPFLAEKEKKRMMQAGNRPIEVVQQEMNASFISGGGAILKPDWFEVVPRSSARVGDIYITVDLAGFKKQEGATKLRTDETVICTTRVHEDNWTVLKIKHGHWDVRQTCANIVLEAREHIGCRLGIEAGALLNACGPYLDEYMRAFGRYITPEPLTHGGTRKVDRIKWALQGRAERHKIKLLTDEDLDADQKWIDHFLAQAGDFPDPLAHDDLIDALSYVDQMASANFVDPSLDTYEYGSKEDMIYADSVH
jgi:hypothetical protein